MEKKQSDNGKWKGKMSLEYLPLTLKHKENGGGSEGTMRYLEGIKKNGRASDINICRMH